MGSAACKDIMDLHLSLLSVPRMQPYAQRIIRVQYLSSKSSTFANSCSNMSNNILAVLRRETPL